MRNGFHLVHLVLLWAFAAVLQPSLQGAPGYLPGFGPGPWPGEQILQLTDALGVRIQINAPILSSFRARQPVNLIIYALPNGNTIEQTVGKQMKPGDDWHFNIQHIGAQTRFLRSRSTNETIVVAYLENDLKSWPSWRKKHGDTAIPQIIESVKRPFKEFQTRLALTGHSGGGSFTFGYLNNLETIPDEVERIAFLDSNYGYDTRLHQSKLTGWLKGSKGRLLVVLAYHDSIALLDGKTFVSAAGGTWGKSQQMRKDFGAEFPLLEKLSTQWQQYSGLDGRVKFFLRENPEKKILHTVQVELNGFIHAMVCGTPLENEGYEYFGKRAYTSWIEE